CSILPKNVLNTLDKINRDFLWGSSDEKRKVQLINWDTVTKPKWEGGLGIRKMESKNQATFAWRFLHEQGSLWAQVLRHKYFDSNLSPKFPHSDSDSDSWNVLHKGRDICISGYRSIIRNGLTTSFGHDNWTGCGPLRTLLSGPLVTEEDSRLVAECLGTDGWDLSRLSLIIPESIFDHISSQSIPLHRIGDDVRIRIGDGAFCSEECRQQQMNDDERKEKCSLASKKKDDSSFAVKPKPSAAGET
ncbi:hypothetical protein CRG98_050138, partial [Punica granatum]